MFLQLIWRFRGVRSFKKNGSGQRVYRRVLRTTGETESFVDECVKAICQRWLTKRIPIRTTILASLGQIDLHLSTVSDD